jgi:hypothetical protein
MLVLYTSYGAGLAQYERHNADLALFRYVSNQCKWRRLVTKCKIRSGVGHRVVQRPGAVCRLCFLGKNGGETDLQLFKISCSSSVHSALCYFQV